MLCISRRRDQRFFIGADVTVLVTRVGPMSVGLAIAAPRDVPIWREEIDEPPCRPATAAELLADAERHCLRLHAAMTPLASGLPHPLAEAYKAAQALVKQLRAVADGERGAA